MNLFQELLQLSEDMEVAGKVRNLRTQLDQINKQLDAKQQAGEKIDENHPLKKKAAALQQQIDQLNGGAANGDLSEAKNHMGETEYSSYDTWKRACRKANVEVWFDGDKDICNAFVGTKPYKRGETRAIGEWDGSVGAVHHDVHRVKKDETIKEEIEDLLREAVEQLYEREPAAIKADPTRKLSLSRIHTVMLSPSDAAFKGTLKDKVFGIRNEDPIIDFLLEILGVPKDGTPYKIRTGFMKYEAQQKMLFIAKFKSDLPGQQLRESTVVSDRAEAVVDKIYRNLSKVNVQGARADVKAVFVGGSSPGEDAFRKKVVAAGYNDAFEGYGDNREFFKKLGVTSADFEALCDASL